MPKQKTHRGAAKRFSLTKTGKVKHKKMNANHIYRRIQDGTRTESLYRGLHHPVQHRPPPHGVEL